MIKSAVCSETDKKPVRICAKTLAGSRPSQLPEEGEKNKCFATSCHHYPALPELSILGWILTLHLRFCILTHV